ncbi:COR domain-containing protein [Flavobacterium sp. C3NV]|uniref:COR domain-containing protein n=1 Tax=Flavobacterium sp. C3NV TaxID=3393358 RepID=UPI00398FFB93
MTKQKIKKPDLIIQLEKEYNITLSCQIVKRFRINLHLDESTYSLNEAGDITGLSLFDCNVENTEIINNFTNLEYLNLTSNRIIEIKFPNLKKLKYLFLGGNPIRNIAPLTNFKNLKILAIWGIPEINTEVIKQLTNLEELHCPESNIESLSFIKNLKKLKLISLRKNKINDISELETINPKIDINLNDNLITDIPYSIAKKYNFLENCLTHELHSVDPEAHRISLSSNPLQFPPNSVVELGQKNVENYYLAAKEFGYAPLSEGRIIVVGDGSAGKSSLIERVLHNTYENGKTQTNGVKIDNWKLKHNDGRELFFHIWDFGGQEIQHAVHRFFFTDGCLYILVLDNRKEEDPEYWLRQIESLGGSAAVLVVFNKQDENQIEITDKKFLKEKYPNIVGFYNTSCSNGKGIDEFVNNLKFQVMTLNTVDEKFPNNWFTIKKSIEECTSGQHYLNYDYYNEICNQNNATDPEIQKLLLKYFTTIGAVTWFGDTYLNFLHVLSPAWITQGVYKIITAKKTANLFGQINIKDFKELLEPISIEDYTYDEQHYGYILSMMKKFDLCYTPDDKILLLPSAFGKTPKMEYSDFNGDNVRTYIFQFKDYMPLAILHRFMAKKLQDAYESNFWFSGIVILDKKSNSLAMVHADKEAKRIYVRIKGESKLGVWEHIRREFEEITRDTYLTYSELISLDESHDYTVEYEDLINHLRANKSQYFHSKLQRDFNVGYLIGLFENRNETIEKFKKGELRFDHHGRQENNLPLIINILNQNSSHTNTQVNTQINIDIDLALINNLGSDIKGEANYILDKIDKNNKDIIIALKDIIQFVDDTKVAQNANQIKEKGWGRKLKNVITILSSAGEKIKNIQDGSESLNSLINGLKNLAQHVNLNEIHKILENFSSSL